MNIQKSCEIVEELLAKECDKKFKSKLTSLEFLALNNILLEMQMMKKYNIPEGIN